jgi:hypothetical protein
MPAFDFMAIKALAGEAMSNRIPAMLAADAQYLDSSYDSFAYTLPNFGAPAAASPAMPVGTVYAVNCSGRTPPQSPYGWTKLNLGYHVDRERWSVTAYVENASNTTVLNVVTPQPLAGEAIFSAAVRPPRSYGVRGTATF